MARGTNVPFSEIQHSKGAWESPTMGFENPWGSKPRTEARGAGGEPEDTHRSSSERQLVKTRSENPEMVRDAQRGLRHPLIAFQSR
jgi:hypothetical protein